MTLLDASPQGLFGQSCLVADTETLFTPGRLGLVSPGLEEAPLSALLRYPNMHALLVFYVSNLFCV